MVRGWGGNMDNYAVIYGKRVELTDEQVKTLGFEVRNNPFKRVSVDELYYFIDSVDDIGSMPDFGDKSDQKSLECANYFNDESFAEQVALHQLLYRKLLKYAYDNECEDTAEWNCCWLHYRIHYSCSGNKFDVDSNDIYKIQGAVYFATQNGAEQAIKEVVEPFIKEHPDFVW